jgi:ribosomal protein S18 acetylase RimI-like enzyme
MSVTIRPAKPADYPEVVRMIRALQVHVGETELPKVSVEALIAEGPTGHGNFNILIAEQEGAVIGLCLYTLAFSGWRGKSGIFVEDLYVEPHLRGSGIGKRLLKDALEAEKDRGAAYIKLEIALANTSALAFYRRIGFDLHEGEGLMVLEPGKL